MSDSEYFAKSVPFGASADAPNSAEASTGPTGALTLQIKADLKAAMLAKDEPAKATLRMALAALQNAEVSGTSARALSPAEELAVLTREVNTRREAATTYADAGRPELAAQESAEADFLARYLPAPLSPAELEALVDAEVGKCATELGSAPTMKQMGALVKAVSAQSSGRATGGEIAALVKARLVK